MAQFSDGRYSDCRVLVVSEDPEEPDFECDDCDVTIAAGYVEVVYFDSEGPVVFGGRERASGFELVCRSRPRTATLELRGATLTGVWEEGDARGSWRVELPDGALG